MKSTTCLLVLLVSIVFFGCRKEKASAYSGQLLLSKKFPTPLANRKIEIYQRGSGSGAFLPIGASSASATAVTDPNGYFQIRFIFGKGIFMAIPTTNANPLVLKSSDQDTSYPGFRRDNFTDSVYNPSQPIFIGKTIDTLIIKVTLLTDLAPTDTIGLRGGGTITGRLDREYTGRSGSAGSVMVLDTIVNALFTDFDYLQRKFRNGIYGGRKYMTSVGYVTIVFERPSFPFDFSEEDEAKSEITIAFKK